MAAVLENVAPSDGSSFEEHLAAHELIADYIREGQQSRLTFVVIGEAGEGKSTLINSLIGKDVAKESDGLHKGTNHVVCHKFEQNSVEVKVWDTPGFGLGDEAEESD